MKLVWTTVAAAVLSGCAAGLGGAPDPVTYTMAGVEAGGASAEQVAAQLAPANADFALVVAPRDAAWFTQLAQATNLGLSGPAFADSLGLAFLSRLELLGDTSMVLGSGDAAFTMQDALYQVEDERYLDLLLVNLPQGVNVDAAIRALLEYMATDVMANASVVLGVRAATAADAARADSMLRAAFMNAVECGGLSGAERTYRLFFGPPARTRCTAAQVLDGPADAITARISVGLQY
jgi:hypothetical protein